MDQQPVNRRSFLTATTAAAAGAALTAGTSWAQAPAAGNPAAPEAAAAKPARQMYKISLAQWSLQARFYAGMRGNGDAATRLDPMNFAKIAKEDFGIEAIEYVNSFYAGKATDKEYITELKKRADDLGVRSVLIMIDAEGAIGAATEAGRKETVEKHKKWVDMANFLGCHSVRVNAQSQGAFEEQQKHAADGLRKLADYSKKQGINVLVENHGGLSSNGAWLAGVMRLADMPEVGTLPDFGNFRLGNNENYDRYKGVEELMPYAYGVSAKSYDFDEAGNENTLDFKRLLKTVVAHGYRGYVGVEYEGRRLEAFEGIRKTKALLEKIRDELKTENA